MDGSTPGRSNSNSSSNDKKKKKTRRRSRKKEQDEEDMKIIFSRCLSSRLETLVGVSYQEHLDGLGLFPDM